MHRHASAIDSAALPTMVPPPNEDPNAASGPTLKVSTLADTPSGAARRNTMHNRVVADAFVPAGGRPATMHEGNWQDFLLVDEATGGPSTTPSAKVIVEGANLFPTAGARAGRCELRRQSRAPTAKRCCRRRRARSSTTSTRRATRTRSLQDFSR